MSACNAQAISQVGCRLMVASSANTSRPFAPAAWGDIARALATKAAMSADADDFASGSELALLATGFCVAGTSPAELGAAGSRDMNARLATNVMWRARTMRSMRQDAGTLHFGTPNL